MYIHIEKFSSIFKTKKRTKKHKLRSRIIFTYRLNLKNNHPILDSTPTPMCKFDIGNIACKFCWEKLSLFFFFSPSLSVQIVFPDTERDLKQWEVIDLLTYAKPRKKLYRSQLCIDKQGLVKFAAKRISRSFSTRRR